MIIGFGSTEKEFEAAEAQAFKDFCTDAWLASEDDFVTDEFAAEAEKWLKARAAKWREEAARHKTAESFPDRYGDYYATVLSDASHIVAIFNFAHINRRHALSPDGWALMTTKVASVALCTTDHIDRKSGAAA